MTDRAWGAPFETGGLAAVFAHPDDETFSCAGALALAADAGRVTRLLIATRGEAGTADGSPDPAMGDLREDELRCAAGKIGLNEVSVLEGYRDGGVADEPFDRLVDDITAWLAERRPGAIITFGPHGVTGHPDHIVVGSATRWAVERLSESGMAPNAVYVVSPVFGPGNKRFDLSGEEQGVTHRIDVTPVAGRKLAALECHASQPDAKQELTDLRAQLEAEGAIFEGYTRVRPIVPAPHPEFDLALL